MISRLLDKNKNEHEWIRNMIEIQYIGHLGKELDLEREELQWQSSLKDVTALIEQLCGERGEQWSEALHEEKLLVSVNQTMVKKDYPLSDGDEVMFFPPIAGG